MLDFLSGTSKTNRMQLRTVSGLEGDAFGSVFNALVKRKFVRINGDNIMPTVKFRESMQLIDKQ